MTDEKPELTRTITVLNIRIQVTDESPDLAAGGLVFASRIRDLDLGDDCTLRNAIERLEFLEKHLA